MICYPAALALTVTGALVFIAYHFRRLTGVFVTIDLAMVLSVVLGIGAIIRHARPRMVWRAEEPEEEPAPEEPADGPSWPSSPARKREVGQ